MPKVQDILVLFQTSPALDVAPAAWARYEASKGTGIKDLIEESTPVQECDGGDAWWMAGHPDKRAQTSIRGKRRTGAATILDGTIPFQRDATGRRLVYGTSYFIEGYGKVRRLWIPKVRGYGAEGSVRSMP